ncbi:MAG: DUF3078 domain-containing protein [Candidatus Latescibacteria bacterium]|nr:DUF3078 domain-containing protein [Candidatus Latescibacterota bacterium]
MVKQMAKNWLFLLGLLLLCAPSVRGDEDTWLAPRARAQLELDTHIIPKGKGLLFVPTLTSKIREPRYKIFQGNKEVRTANTGTGVLLSPGVYELLIGSGPISQMMREKVQIIEAHTTLVDRPFWSGLTVDVINESRTAINESYELFEEGTQETYGQGYGVEEERGENVKSWLLKPGTYNVVRIGENVSTPRRFSVRLLPGELVQRKLVVDSDGNFVGFYPTRRLRLLEDAPNWKTNWELSLSTLFNNAQNTGNEDRASASLSAQVRNTSQYNTDKNFADVRFTLEAGGIKEGSESFRKSVDEVEIRTTYIYRLSRRIGPYLRGVLNTQLFPTEFSDAPDVLNVISAAGDTLAPDNPNSDGEYTLSPSFFPLQLRQGIGINSRLYRSFPFNMDLRIGLGARQTYVSDSFELLPDRKSVKRLKNASSTGLEALLITDARLGSFITLDSEFDIIMPSGNTDNWEFTFENRLRTFLYRFINVDFVFDFEREQTRQRLQSRQQVLLRFVYLL